MSRESTLSRVMDLHFQMMGSSMRHQTGIIAEANLTLPQMRALIFAHVNDRCATSDAAEFIGVKPNVATGVIQRLVEKGLLARTEDPDDRRVRLLALTEQGSILMDEVTGSARAELGARFDKLSDDQLASLEDILSTIVGPAA